MNSESKLVICCATQNKFQDTKLSNSLKFWFEDNRGPNAIDFVENNTDGLSKIYNNFIEKNLNKGISGLIFIHDDVEINDNNIRVKLISAFNQFDIVGLAGTKKFTLSEQCLWHNSPKETWSGAVAHYHEGKTWVTEYGQMPQQCLLVDGLFLAINLEKISKKGLRFDERFTFHHYDLDFCLQAYKMRIKVGTWPIWVTHHSIGNWDKPEWHKSNKIFREKWKSYV